MTAYGMGELLHTHSQAADVIACLYGLLPIPLADRNDLADRPQSGPLFESLQIARYRHVKVAADLFAAVSLLHRRVTANRDVGEVVVLVSIDVFDDIVMQVALVAFEC